MAKSAPKQVGWTVCPMVGGKFAVAALLEGGKVGNAVLFPFDTKEEAQQRINSGEADRTVQHLAKMKRRKGK